MVGGGGGECEYGASKRLDEETKGVVTAVVLIQRKDRILCGCHWRCSVIEWSQENRQFCDWSRKVIGGLEVEVIGGPAGQVGCESGGTGETSYPGKMKNIFAAMPEIAIICVESGESSHECAFEGS